MFQKRKCRIELPKVQVSDTTGDAMKYWSWYPKSINEAETIPSPANLSNETFV